MIVGSVGLQGNAVVEIAIQGPTGDASLVSAMVDTGFDRFLTLPSDLIATLQLTFVGEQDTFLADEMATKLRVFAAQVDWHGRMETIEILEAEGIPLLGMNLLHGSRLTIDVVEGGCVEIAALASNDKDGP